MKKILSLCLGLFLFLSLAGKSHASTTFLVGSTNNQLSSRIGANAVDYTQFTAQTTGSLNEFHVITVGTGNLKLGIYDGLGNLLNQTGSVAITSTGENVISFPDTSIVAGNQYILAFNQDTNGIVQVTNISQNISCQYVTDFYNPLPSTLQPSYCVNWEPNISGYQNTAPTPTPTPTPTPSTGLTFLAGSVMNQLSSLLSANNLVYTKYTAQASGTLNELHVIAQGTGNLKLALYDGSGNLLNQTGSVAITSSGKNIIPFPDTQITAGNQYILAFNQDANSIVQVTNISQNISCQVGLSFSNDIPSTLQPSYCVNWEPNISGYARTNTPPLISAIPNATKNEGETYSYTGSFTDPDSTSWTGTVDYGDGSGTQSLPLNADKTFSLSHVYKDDGTYTLTVSISDNQEATGTGTATITVNNVVPTVGAISVSPNPVQVTTATSASATFTDPGVLDTHTASWNWGDGNTTTGTVTESNGSGLVSNSHTYSTAGVFTITLTVTDKDSGQGTQTFQYVSVYNPTSQGLFSAGQRFASPAGAYPQNPNLTGNVQFGLSYKYQGTMPVGDKQFTMNFSAANLNFNATTISSLVITNSQATLTGTGTINGTGSYNFLVTGIDGGGIRIQITDAANNNTIVYDTQPGAAATATPTTSVAGHIIVHN